MERYCQAFLQENQLWLQLAFAEMSDKRLLTQHREALLRSLAQLLEELEPEHYAPDKGKGVKTGLEFAADPVAHLTIAAGEVQRQDYMGSTTQQLVIMWRQRAQFMLHIARVSCMVKLDSVQRKDRCEICGQSAGLVVTPIYTLTHLASSYRQQRDMSPLWNMVFWKHFYKTFTPTCTTCEDCRDYYHSRNQNVPVDEKRFRRLQEREKTPFELVQESSFQPVPIDNQSTSILHMWLSWTRKIAAGEDPREFLPSFGIEGRTLTELRQATLKDAKADEDEEDTGIPKQKKDDDLDKLSEYSSELDPDDPESIERARQRKLKKMQKQPVSDDEEDGDEDALGESHPFADKEVEIKWSTRTLALAWLNKAKQNMAAPQLQAWAQPLPPAMALEQEGLPRIPHPSAPALPPPPRPGQHGGQMPVGLPQVPAPPRGGASAATGNRGVPPAPNLAPPPGGGGNANLPPYPGGDMGGGGR
jgi:predicted metal-dependent hydrolase